MKTKLRMSQLLRLELGLKPEVLERAEAEAGALPLLLLVVLSGVAGIPVKRLKA
tara:strand:- start:274 stop:435 length:162 start_codon:yes stop_codon:yes gene_type:complete